MALIARGPCIQIAVTMHEDVAQQLVQQGRTLPDPLPGLAMIDTGATSTCIDEAAAQRLGLPVVDVVEVASASHASTRQNVYPLQIEILGTAIRISSPRSIGAPLAAQGLLALIGRDVLQHGTLHYNGFRGEITFAV